MPKRRKRPANKVEMETPVDQTRPSDKEKDKPQDSEVVVVVASSQESDEENAQLPDLTVPPLPCCDNHGQAIHPTGLNIRFAG
jgi:hypothetical protein